MFGNIRTIYSRAYLPILMGVLVLTGFLSTIANPANATMITGSMLVSTALIVLAGPAQRIRERVVPLRQLRLKNGSDLPPLLARHLRLWAPWAPLAAAVIPAFSLVYAVAVAVYFAPYASRLVAEILQRRKIIIQTKERISSSEPKVILYVSGPEEVYYQVNQWLPVLEKLSLKTAIVLRNSAIVRRMENTTLDVYFAQSGREVEWILNHGPQVALYPNNRDKNVNSLRHPHISHVFINHGESDKSVNQSQMLMAYDHIFVGGELAESRLRQAGFKLHAGQVKHVGRPQAEMALEYVEGLRQPKNILYAPTWEGGVEATSYSSVGPVGLRLLKEIAASGDYSLKFKPHPLTGKNLPAAAAALREMERFCRANNMEVLSPSNSLHDAMNWSDLMICDVSAVLNEYLVTGKPIILCNILGSGLSKETLHAEFPSSAAAYVLYPQESIAAVLSEIASADSMKLQRAQTRRLSMGEGNSFSRFEAALKELAD